MCKSTKRAAWRSRSPRASRAISTICAPRWTCSSASRIARRSATPATGSTRRQWASSFTSEAVLVSSVSVAKVAVPPAIEIAVGVAHGVRRGAPEHHLEIDGLEAVVDVAVDDAGRAGDALPFPEPRLNPVARLVLEEDGQEAVEHEEDLLDLVGVRGVSLARLHIHDAE